MHKNIIRAAAITAGALLIPLFGNLYVDGWNWSFGDFIFAFILIFAAVFAFELVRTGTRPRAYKAAAGMALAASFLLVWIDAAAGIIGEDNPVNLFYVIAVALGIVGVIAVRLRPSGMERVLFSMAVAQVLIPVVALFIDPVNYAPGALRIFVLSSFFAAAFAGSGLLFRRSAAKES